MGLSEKEYKGNSNFAHGAKFELVGRGLKTPAQPKATPAAYCGSQATAIEAGVLLCLHKMPGKFTIDETLNTLKAIFEKHKHERVCVIGTICVGKTTLLNRLSDYNCVDMDAELWPNLPDGEMDFLNQLLKKPWTKETGDEIDRLTYKYLKAKPGCPLFASVIVDCEAVVYLDINDELLAEHCKNRGEDFASAKNIKEAVEGDWNNHREKGGKVFYYLTVTE
ncbi:hypothetical protein FACS189490_13990 [Clostridia bacterium]|nr:hypothetical protein FACS189490_13990 [Clostridia bacterium]